MMNTCNHEGTQLLDEVQALRKDGAGLNFFEALRFIDDNAQYADDWDAAALAAYAAQWDANARPHPRQFICDDCEQWRNLDELRYSGGEYLCPCRLKQ